MSSVTNEYSKLREQEISGLKKKVTSERRVIEDLHKKSKADLSRAHESEIVEIRNDHANTIDQAHERREKILADLERNLDQTKQMTEKQISKIKDDTKAAETKIDNDHQSRRMLLNANQEQHLQESNFKYNNQVNKINSDGENRIQTTKENLSMKHDEIDKQFQQKIQDTTNRHQYTLKTEENQFKTAHKTKQNEFKAAEQNLYKTHQNNIIEQTDTNKKLYDTRSADFRNKFSDQDKFFEKKFEGQLTSHHQQLSGLDQKFDNISKTMKKDLMNKIENVESKSDDIFFEFTELNSSIKDNGDHYQVDVTIPEYAKKDLRLTTNSKEVILTLNRRYQDQVDKDNIKHKVNKIETLSSRIPTDSFLNPKKITSSFDQGVMTYKIAKA